MAHRSSATRIGRRWLFVLFPCIAWLSVGCNPQTLSMFMLPFADDKKEPEYKLFAADKEITLVITSNFATPQFQQEILPAERELADSVGDFLRKRCKENKHALKIVPQADVCSYQLKQRSIDGDDSALAAGKHFKADYVLDLNIEAFGLYQKGGYPKMYRGTTRINIQLLNVKIKDEDPTVFRKTFTCEYSGSRGIPLEVGNSNPADFRLLFLRRLGRDISRIFIAFPQDELKEWDRSGDGGL